MKEYALRDFARYYNHSFVIDPSDGKLGQLVFVSAFRGDDGAIVPDSMRISKHAITERTRASDLRALPIIDHNTLEWRHVRRPTLGYRHSENGKKLYFASIDRGDQIPKGLNNRCVLLENPINVRGVSIRIGLPKAYQVSSFPLTFKEALELHKPNFVSFKQAIEKLSSDRELCVGFALSHDTAITLGTAADSAFVLLFRGTPAAYSKDGAKWEYTSKEYKGVLDRHAK